MHRPRRWNVFQLFSLAALAAAAGCAGTQLTSVRSEPAEQRTERAQRARQQLHHEALLAAAESDWRLGRLPECREALDKLLQADPQHRQARQMLADLYLATDDLPAAEGELRALLERDPRDAQTHLSLALLLDIAGRGDESREHLRQAAELAPSEQLVTLLQDTRPSRDDGPPATAVAAAAPAAAAPAAPQDEAAAPRTILLTLPGTPPAAAASRPQATSSAAPEALPVGTAPRPEAALVPHGFLDMGAPQNR